MKRLSIASFQGCPVQSCRRCIGEPYAHGRSRRWRLPQPSSPDVAAQYLMQLTQTASMEHSGLCPIPGFEDQPITFKTMCWETTFASKHFFGEKRHQLCTLPWLFCTLYSSVVANGLSKKKKARAKWLCICV